MSEFAEKVVLVTGAGRGIGRAIALAYAKRGAILAVNDLTPVNLDGTVAEISSCGGRVKEYIFDVAKKMPVQEMVDEILNDWGRIDILVNNAGVHPYVSLLDMDEWDLRRTLDVNLCGPFFTTQQVSRAMRTQGGGVIINIAAAFGRAQGLKDSAAFIASKMGLIGLTRQAALELAPYNIRVNAVCPGWIETEGIANGIARQIADGWTDHIPLERHGLPDEVAETVVFLSSQSASYLTGQAINLDGGLVMS
jgi:NAD(P)-dependent dehydrogenase (short-subunit alcohol dehydrogenase family)